MLSAVILRTAIRPSSFDSWYFEQVISSGNGIRRHPLFFMEWCFKRQKPERQSSVGSSGKELLPQDSVVVSQQELADVKAERDRVQALDDFTDSPIVIKDVQKVYPGLDGGKPKVRAEGQRGAQRRDEGGTAGEQGEKQGGEVQG